MRALATAVATVSCMSSLANAATVDAGAFTTVTVEAPLYDTRLSAANGCNPAGCVGDLTRVRYAVYVFTTICVDG